MNKTQNEVVLPLLVILLSVFGIIAVYCASSYNALIQYSDGFFYAKKQAVGVAAGTCAMLLASLIDYQKLKKLAVPFYIISIILLALVFVPALGKTSYGATRWIKLGSITVQPSEIAKYALVLLLAAYVAKFKSKINKFTTVIPMLALGGLVCALVFLEPNMSITVCIAAVMLGMVFISGTGLKNIIIIASPLVAVICLLIVAEPYRLLRLSAYLDPWETPQGEGYQLIQSLYALGNGGLFGVGLFNSRQKYRFLPFAESDFIISIVGEELGFIGIAAIFCIAIVIIYRGLRISANSRDVFGGMLACGITLVYAVQVFVNALVVSGAIPPTGLPMPLISAGNTSIIMSMAAMGVLMGISKRNKNREALWARNSKI